MKIFKILFLVLVVLFGVGYVGSFVNVANAQTAPPAPVTVTLTATPQNVSVINGLQSEKFVLAWASTGADYCKGSNYFWTTANETTIPTRWYPPASFGPNANLPYGVYMTPSGSATFTLYGGVPPGNSGDIPFSVTCFPSVGESATSNNVLVKFTVLNGVSITSPSAGDSWKIGDSQTINWTFPDVFSTDATSVVKISVVDKDGKSHSIVPINGVSNTGSFTWKAGDALVFSGSATSAISWVPTTLPASGSPYQIWIMLSGKHTGTVGSNKISFNLTDSGSGTSGESSATPTITITSPVANSSWASGSSQTIRWQTTGLDSNATGHVFIDKKLSNEDMLSSTNIGSLKYRYLVASVSNTGSYTWNSVGTVYGLDPNRDKSFYNPCNYTQPLWSCYKTPTTVPAGAYSMNIWLQPANMVATNPLGGNFAPSVDLTIGSVSSTSTAPLCDYAPPPQGCTYTQGPNYNPQTSCGMILRCTSATSTVTGSDTSPQALKQQLVQLITLLLQLVQQAAARGLLSVDQLTSILSSIQIPR